MQVFTMGFTKKDAALFFKKIEDNKIQMLIDVRLNNSRLWLKDDF